MDMNFCRRCGTRLSTDDGDSFRCANNHTLFINGAPTASIIVVNSAGNLLLSRRGIEPGKGLLDSFGGFIDNMETAEDAAIRELEEETGLTPDHYGSLHYVGSGAGTYTFENEARSVLTLCYLTWAKPGAELVAKDDVAEIVEIPPTELNLDDLWNEDIRVGFRNIHTALKGGSHELSS